MLLIVRVGGGGVVVVVLLCIGVAVFIMVEYYKISIYIFAVSCTRKCHIHLSFMLLVVLFSEF